eukprot:scaffold1034_cov418-Prasinococcus_capsulatus_cf.AAC.20
MGPCKVIRGCVGRGRRLSSQFSVQWADYPGAARRVNIPGLGRRRPSSVPCRISRSISGDRDDYVLRTASSGAGLCSIRRARVIWERWVSPV